MTNEPLDAHMIRRPAKKQWSDLPLWLRITVAISAQILGAAAGWVLAQLHNSIRG